MKKLFLAALLLISLFQYKSAFAQDINPLLDSTKTSDRPLPVTYLVKGRILGMDLEDLSGVTVTNICNTEKTTSGERGFYQLRVIKGDTLLFEYSRYSKGKHVVKNPKENFNVVLIRRKTDKLPEKYSPAEYKKASKADEELYDILDKGAKRDGMWKY